MNHLTYDVVIIGGGISGLITLKQMKERGLTCVLLEKQSHTGGIWNRLPSWQDIQHPPIDWTLNGIPMAGPLQKDVLQNINSWVSVYELGSSIRLNTAVQRVQRDTHEWKITTNDQTYFAKHLVVCTGLQNVPYVPALKRDDDSVRQIHSSQLHDAAVLSGKSVTIVGGGASAFDLIELAFAQGAREVNWVFRSVKWFVPSLRSKHVLPQLRWLAWAQMLSRSTDKLSNQVHQQLVAKYRRYGLEALLPSTPFHYERDALVSGRATMLQRFKEIRLFRDEVESVEKGSVLLKQGEIKTDIVLWATGYRLDLEYLHLPKLAGINTREKLAARCHYLIGAADYPNLYFIAPTILDSTSSTPFLTAVLSRSLASLIANRVEIPARVFPGRVNHWDLLKMLAEIDRENFPRGWWRLKSLWRAWHYKKNSQESVSID